MRTLVALALLAACCMTQAADPIGISISPISVTLDRAHPASAITLTNSTAETKVMQAAIMTWTHENGEERFTPATEMLVSPPMFRVAAGAKQVVRVGLKSRKAANSDSEKTYRLFLEEVPESVPEKPAEGAVTGLRMMLRFGLPVFLQPAQPLPEAMNWKALRSKDGSILLSVMNSGNRHLRLSEVKLESGTKTLIAPSFAYVFAGETHTWALRPDASWPADSAVTVSARTDEGLVHAAFSLQSP